MTDPHDRPLGVFDSGIGGLTVLAEIHRILPNESAIYLGDTARVPYGTKSSSVVTRYALNNSRFLVDKGIKLLVVACNTASAVALPALKAELDVPVIGVIEPGARRAAELTRSASVGIIGTEGTVYSGAYSKALESLSPEIKVVQRACPLFVPLAEEGWGDHQVTQQVAAEYLNGLSDEIDTLVLGCTHYPLLIPAIQAAVGPQVTLVDSASVVAQAVAAELGKSELACPAGKKKASSEFFVTDVPKRFCKVGQRFLGHKLDSASQVDLEMQKLPAGSQS